MLLILWKLCYLSTVRYNHRPSKNHVNTVTSKIIGGIIFTTINVHEREYLWIVWLFILKPCLMQSVLHLPRKTRKQKHKCMPQKLQNNIKLEQAYLVQQKDEFGKDDSSQCDCDQIDRCFRIFSVVNQFVSVWPACSHTTSKGLDKSKAPYHRRNSL